MWRHFCFVRASIEATISESGVRLSRTIFADMSSNEINGLGFFFILSDIFRTMLSKFIPQPNKERHGSISLRF